MPAAADTGRRSARLDYDRAARKARLDGNVQVLYHATNASAATAIRTTGKFLRGVNGARGGGIYFATTRNGVMIVLVVGTYQFLRFLLYFGDS